MNNELYLKRLSEVSEWHRPSVGPNGALSVNKRAKSAPLHPGPITEQELNDMSEEELEEYREKLEAWQESQPNPSLAPKIIKIKAQCQPCDDCGRQLNEAHKVEHRCYDSGITHWRSRCTNCGLFRHPQTGQYTITQAQAHQFFNSYYRSNLGKYMSKYQRMRLAEGQTAELLPRQGSQAAKAAVMHELDLGDRVVYSQDPISGADTGVSGK
jgi:hypothetical protein